MTVSAVTQSTQLGSSASTASASGSSMVDEAQSRFMKLLVAQMKNQDPLNPMDNAQMTSQIAQLNTVSGIHQLNSNMQSLLANFQSSQQVQATAMLGREVWVRGDGIQLDASGARLQFDASADASSTQVVIKSTAGEVLRTLDSGRSQAGLNSVIWDGKDQDGNRVPDGAYRFEVKAMRNGVPVSIETLSSGRVESVSMGPGGLSMNVSKLGYVPVSDVRQVQ